MDLSCFCSVLCLLCLCAHLFICALWSPAGKGLTSWLSFVVSNNVLLLLYVHSSFSIILMGKRELVALLSMSSWCLLNVV